MQEEQLPPALAGSDVSSVYSLEWRGLALTAFNSLAHAPALLQSHSPAACAGQGGRREVASVTLARLREHRADCGALAVLRLAGQAFICQWSHRFRVPEEDDARFKSPPHREDSPSRRVLGRVSVGNGLRSTSHASIRPAAAPPPGGSQVLRPSSVCERVCKSRKKKMKQINRGTQWFRQAGTAIWEGAGGDIWTDGAMVPDPSPFPAPTPFSAVYRLPLSDGVNRGPLSMPDGPPRPSAPPPQQTRSYDSPSPSIFRVLPLLLH
ncbi:hypothetical protein SKAU_G00198400 [Synaphobranchus kaupii]|uniref:Uncharacterized protein n=1 Tax=Synaphobranchus kaupii TaxID=118154 RepID=A0A9Q1FEW7_SYNKA|nr:hypothetical protein SKAU_G00198400 [Synaphobranchus kaupii]